MQDGMPGAAAPVSMKAPREGRGNDGTVESVGNQERVSPSSPRPLGISQRRRDSHIPTARRRPAGERGKPNSGFPQSPAKRATTNAALSSEHQNQTLGRPARKTGERSLTARSPLPFQYHLALGTKVDFSIILRLENAECPKPRFLRRVDTRVCPRLSPAFPCVSQGPLLAAWGCPLGPGLSPAFPVCALDILLL